MSSNVELYVKLYEDTKFDAAIVTRAVGTYLEVFSNDDIALCSRSLSVTDIDIMIAGLQSAKLSITGKGK